LLNHTKSTPLIAGTGKASEAVRRCAARWLVRYRAARARTTQYRAVLLKLKKQRAERYRGDWQGRRRAAASLVRYGAVRARNTQYGAVSLKLKKQRPVMVGTRETGKVTVVQLLRWLDTPPSQPVPLSTAWYLFKFMKSRPVITGTTGKAGKAARRRAAGSLNSGNRDW
jgi:hypothetical protein